MKSIFAFGLLMIAAGACQSPPGPARAKRVEPADATTTQGMNAIKALAGSWEGAMRGDKDNTVYPTTAVFVVSSGGSVVREIMGAGTEYEMTNLYHLDGNQIVVTHYCAAGNQPRMVSTAVNPHHLVFELDSVSNYTGGEHGYMGKVELEFVNKDQMIQRWTSFDGKDGAHSAVFDMKRKH